MRAGAMVNDNRDITTDDVTEWLNHVSDSATLNALVDALQDRMDALLEAMPARRGRATQQREKREEPMKQDDDHSTIHVAEVEALEPTDWEQWVEQVEAVLGYDTDGEFAVDGYSLGSFYKMWKQGWTVEKAVAADKEAHRAALLTEDE